jgi:hypothetical protein
MARTPSDLCLSKAYHEVSNRDSPPEMTDDAAGVLAQGVLALRGDSAAIAQR